MNKKHQFYRIADICIETVFDSSWKMSSFGVLENYVCEPAESDVVLHCFVVDELPCVSGQIVYYEERKHIKALEDGFVRYYGHGDDVNACYACSLRQGNRFEVYVKDSALVDGIPSHLMAELFELEHLLAQRQGILLHASVICVDDEAILFTAPSKTGKSTQASLWEMHEGAEIINGDRCAVVIENQDVFVYGIPFAGSSGIRKNVKLPLKGIVYLRQAKENRTVVCHGVRAFQRVYKGVSVQLWDHDDVQCVMDTVTQITQSVPVIELECRPDYEAVCVLKKKLEELEHERSE